jgi:diaminopropionate ammonia-lyase
MQKYDFIINPNYSKTINLDLYLERILSSDEGYFFHRSLPGYSPTPLRPLPVLAKDLNIGELWVKDESQRFGLNAFKGLGASFAVHKYLEDHPGNHTFCTATDGNHGKALAWICRLLNHSCTVFVPRHTIAERIQAIQIEKAEVIIVDGNYEMAIEEAKNYSAKRGAVLIQDGSWQGYEEIPATIMQGYQTSFRELDNWLESHPIDLILIQAGVGSWAASAVWYFSRSERAPRIIVVEPFETDCILESIINEKASMTSKSGKTVLACLDCGFPSILAYEVLHQGAYAFLSIPDDLSIEAMKRLYYPKGNDRRIISGESGAAGLGGLISLCSGKSLDKFRKDLGLNKDTRVLLFNTEGMNDKELFEEMVLGSR